MSYTLPVFNLDVNIWRWPAIPPLSPTDHFPANLAYGRRIHGAGGAAEEAFLHLLCPAHTDIRSAFLTPFHADFVEVPAGSLRLYQVVNVDDSGKGFANEHRVALLTQIAVVGYWPVPMP